MARVVFMGTPDFAVPILEAVLANHEVVAVVTQPDRPAGRGRREQAQSPVKQAAEQHGLRLLQPSSLRRDKAAVAALRELQPDVLVLAAYGQILRADVLNLAPYGCVGVHASLLPKYRGAAPITAAILEGEPETGISLMLTDVGMDTGLVLAQRALPIAPDDTTASLTARLAQVGALMIAEDLPRWLGGELSPQPQDESLASYAPQIAREDARVDWRLPAVRIERQIRAYTPWPGSYTSWQDHTLKLISATCTAGNVGAEPGRIYLDGSRLCVQTGDGSLCLDVIQLAGKRAMAADEFVRGQRAIVGARLGES